MKIVLGNIVGWTLFIFFLISLVFLADAFHWIKVVLAYFMGATFTCSVLILIYQFIKWLFIEPYKEWKESKSFK
jgi:hypothetical protein